MVISELYDDICVRLLVAGSQQQDTESRFYSLDLHTETCGIALAP